MDLTKINTILAKLSYKVISVLGDRLRKIILYGSYSRGDYFDDSDIDIMVLANINDEIELQELEKFLWNIGWDIGTEYDIIVSLSIKDYTHFHEWIDAMAYYKNINNEGIVLYGS